MTDDKDFKHLVRAEARRTGRRYTDVRSELRSPEGGGGGGGAVRSGVAEQFDDIVSAIETWRYGPREQAWLTALALVVPGYVLVRGAPGNGMTALGQGVAAAIGSRLTSIDGRGGFGEHPPEGWQPDDVVVIAHVDGLSPAEQARIVHIGPRSAIVLAKRHPIADRMPHPPDDEIRERFLFGIDFDHGDFDTQLRILNEYQDRTSQPRREAVVSAAGLGSLREAVDGVTLPEPVRRSIVSVVDAARSDPAVLVGPSVVATLNLARATAAAALVDGRVEATLDDVARLLEPVLAHRIVLRAPDDGDGEGVDALLDRLRGTLR